MNPIAWFRKLLFDILTLWRFEMVSIISSEQQMSSDNASKKIFLHYCAWLVKSASYSKRQYHGRLKQDYKWLLKTCYKWRQYGFYTATEDLIFIYSTKYASLKFDEYLGTIISNFVYVFIDKNVFITSFTLHKSTIIASRWMTVRSYHLVTIIAVRSYHLVTIWSP